MATPAPRSPRDDTYRAKLLADPRVRRWWQSQRLGSPITADVNLRQLSAFLRETRLAPHEVVRLAKEESDRFQEIVVDYADALTTRGRLASYVAKTFVGVKSWLKFNGVEFSRFPKLKVLQGASLRSERTPTPAELRRLLGVLSPRGRVVALMMAHAGVRPGVLGNIDGTDGLTLGDLPELSLKGELQFRKVPFLVQVASKRSKNRLDYVTFGTGELAEAILAYLSDRRAHGEKLTPDSPLANLSAFASANYRRRRMLGRFITTKAIAAELRAGLTKVLPEGVAWRPYVLRAYCSTQLWAAGNHGKIDRDAREAIMGHDLGVAGRYHLSKRLHPELLEELRAAYARCDSYLSTLPTVAADSIIAESRRNMLLALEYTERELGALDLVAMPQQELDGLVAKKRAERQARVAPPAPAGGARPRRPNQKVVEESELEKYLDQGWSVLQALASGRVVLSPPEG